MRHVFLPVALAAATLAAAQAPPAPLPNSPLAWDVRDGTHPKLGPIKVAVPSSSIVTAVGKEKILSLVFVSCEKSRGKIAIELANAAQSDARSGLYPKQMPRMFCNPRSTAPRAELAAPWYVSEIGDAMARGLAPSDLRRCASVEIVQEVALPRGWGSETQRIEIEIIPYKRELETVLAGCTEPALQAEAPAAAVPAPAPPVATAAPKPTPPAAPPTPAPPAIATPRPNLAAVAPKLAPPSELPWKNARTIASGRTNVRAGPDLHSAVVKQLDPGALVLVQATDTDWWRVRPHSGGGFTGYIRGDRLSFR